MAKCVKRFTDRKFGSGHENWRSSGCLHARSQRSGKERCRSFACTSRFDLAGFTAGVKYAALAIKKLFSAVSIPGFPNWLVRGKLTTMPDQNRRWTIVGRVLVSFATVVILT